MIFFKNKVSKQEDSRLSKGFKFIIATEYINETEYMNFVLPFGQLYRDINSEEISSENLNILKIKLLDTVTSSYAEIKSCRIKANLSSGEKFN